MTDQLPSEIWETIFGFLEYEALKNLRQTNITFRSALGNKYWKRRLIKSKRWEKDVPSALLEHVGVGNIDLMKVYNFNPFTTRNLLSYCKDTSSGFGQKWKWRRVFPKACPVEEGNIGQRTLSIRFGDIGISPRIRDSPFLLPKISILVNYYMDLDKTNLESRIVLTMKLWGEQDEMIRILRNKYTSILPKGMHMGVLENEMPCFPGVNGFDLSITVQEETALGTIYIALMWPWTNLDDDDNDF